MILSEPVQPFGEGMRVIGPDGTRVDRGPVRAAGRELSVGIDARQEGTYRVHWQVIAEDTHPTVGSFAFSVRHPSAVAFDETPGAVAPLGLFLQVAARWIHFVGLTLAFGLLLVIAVVERNGESDREGSTPGKVLWTWMNRGIGCLLVAEPLALLGQTASLGTASILDPDAMSAALDSSFGRAMGLRLGVALALWVIAGFAREGSRGVVVWGLAAGGLLAVIDGLSAHAVETRPVWLGLIANGLHLAAMAAWTGGVIGLVIVRRQPGRVAAMGDTTGELGRLVLGAGGILGLTGPILALQHLAALGDVLAPGYGEVLLAKLAAVVLAAALGLAATRAGRTREPFWREAEAGALFGVLGLAALLVSLAPPR